MDSELFTDSAYETFSGGLATDKYTFEDWEPEELL